MSSVYKAERIIAVRFSERKGFTKIDQVIQLNGVSDSLRNSLWNVLHVGIWNRPHFQWSHNQIPGFEKFSSELWFGYFKRPIDLRPSKGSGVVAEIRAYFFSCPWYEVYDFLEWVLARERSEELNRLTNHVLEVELAGYRYVGGSFTNITAPLEVAALQEALDDDEFPGVRAHLEAALKLLSDRQSPDYRNSIKESILAVEGMAQIAAGKPKATLGDALAVLQRDKRLHPALAGAFSKLYGYTSDAAGIRHAMLDVPDLTAADAKFFLISCTTFTGYLKAKL